MGSFPTFLAMESEFLPGERCLPNLGRQGVLHPPVSISIRMIESVFDRLVDGCLLRVTIIACISGRACRD